MKKKYLNEGCACEGEETMPKHAEYISVDQVNRYMLQMTDEEQETMSFRDVIAGILRTKPENIASMKRSGLGWKVRAMGDMDDLEGILDDNVSTLRRLKGADDEEEESSEFDEITDRKAFHNFMKAYADGDLALDIEVNGKPADAYMTKGNGVCLETSAGKIYTKMVQRVDIRKAGNTWEGWIGANGSKLQFNAEQWDDEDDDMEDWEREGYGSEIAYKNRWRDYRD